MPSSIHVRRLHAYAGRHPSKLAQALHVMQKAHPAADSVSMPDAWGNTLLHTACASSGALTQVSTLLRAGARVDAIGPYGMTPLAAALMAGQYKAAKRVAQAGGGVALGAFNEPSERSFLANVFGLDGVTHLGGQAFELEGAFEFGVYPRLAQAVEAFAKTCADPNVFSPTLWAKAVGALREAPGHLWRGDAEVRAMAKAGHPMLLLTGWRGHSACVALVGDAGVRANRLRAHPWTRFETLAPWRWSGAAPSLHLIRQLRHNRGRPAFWGRCMLAWMDATHSAAGGFRWASACRSLAPQPQKGNNCAVANAKAGLLALLVLMHAKTGAPQDAPQTRAMYAEYKRLTTFLRIYTLERYRALHAEASGAASNALPDSALQDNVLIARCEAKLRAARWRRKDVSSLHAHGVRAIEQSC